jgi:hypothetical protein
MADCDMSGLVEDWFRDAGGPLWDDASGVAERGVYPGAGDVLAVVQALGVDAQQDFDAVSARAVTRGAGTPAASRVRLRRAEGRRGARPGAKSPGQGEGQGSGLGPDIADGRGGDGVAANAATSITPAAMPAVVRTSWKPNSPVHSDRR